jgi:hypothetical protein
METPFTSSTSHRFPRAGAPLVYFLWPPSLTPPADGLDFAKKTKDRSPEKPQGKLLLPSFAPHLHQSQLPPARFVASPRSAVCPTTRPTCAPRSCLRATPPRLCKTSATGHPHFMPSLRFLPTHTSPPIFMSHDAVGRTVLGASFMLLSVYAVALVGRPFPSSPHSSLSLLGSQLPAVDCSCAGVPCRPRLRLSGHTPESDFPFSERQREILGGRGGNLFPHRCLRTHHSGPLSHQ